MTENGNRTTVQELGLYHPPVANFMQTEMTIFNDRKVPMRLQVQHDVGGDDIYVLAPMDMKTVTLRHPDNTRPYFKLWETGQALLSFISKDTA